jgi:flavodoxin
MKRILIAYFSLKSHTEQMAKYVAEGVRVGGCEAEVKPINELKSKEDIQGYDGYIFGCPTYHKDMTENMKRFLFQAADADLSGKAGGSFGSSTHSGEAPSYIFETMDLEQLLGRLVDHFYRTIFTVGDNTHIDVLNNTLQVMEMFLLFGTNLLEITDYIIKCLVQFIKR